MKFLLICLRLLGIRETSFNGRNTLNERNIRKSTSTFASANTVIELICHFQNIDAIFLHIDSEFKIERRVNFFFFWSQFFYIS